MLYKKGCQVGFDADGELWLDDVGKLRWKCILYDVVIMTVDKGVIALL